MSSARCFFSVALGALSMASASAQWTYVDLHDPRFSSTVLYGLAGPDTVAGVGSGSYGRALIWNTSVRDVTPRAASGAMLWDTNGRQSVGTAVLNGVFTAGLWSGTSFASLAPANAVMSEAFGLDGNRQVGMFQVPPANYPVAAIWRGTAASAVILHPPTWDEGSMAFGIYRNTQVGLAATSSFPGAHACRWTNTAGSFVDIHPSGPSNSSVALDVHGSIAVGLAYFRDPSTGVTSARRAWRWSTTGGAGVSMHPAAFAQSQANSVTTGAAVGRVYDAAGNRRAWFWSLPGGRSTDLHRVLPRGTYSHSVAFEVWTDGRRYAVAGAATDATTGDAHAVVWISGLAFP